MSLFLFVGRNVSTYSKHFCGLKTQITFSLKILKDYRSCDKRL